MNIKSSQTLVEEAQKDIETLSAEKVKTLYEKKEITLIDVRDIRELWKEGTIEESKHIPRGMLEFWLDPESSYYKANKVNNFKNYYIDNIFNTIWQDGLNMNDEIIIEKVLKNLNVNPKTFSLRSTSSLIKESLRKKTNEAYEKGIFGAPTYVVNNKIFWGQDRIEFALNEARK